MSRIGRKPIQVPKGVTVTVKPDVLEFKGPKGAMKQGVPPGVSFELNGSELVAKNTANDPMASKFHGLARSLMANAVTGVTDGFKRELDLQVEIVHRVAKEVMKETGKKYEPVTYEGAGHGVMRAGEDPANTNPANVKAHDEAWLRWKDLLKKL